MLPNRNHYFPIRLQNILKFILNDKMEPDRVASNY